nr:Coenzyme F420 hydrogenase/dehydrogenase, beta subunit C-terminal domain [Candidatus Sigynarchaeota archaeon]
MDNVVADRIESEKSRVKGKFKASFATLKKKVIDAGLCIECGKCSVLGCIQLDAATRKPELAGKCDACGLCYYLCPESLGSPLGDFISAHVTASASSEVHGQDGGTVTALLAGLLKDGVIEAAIVTRQDPARPWHPLPFIATTREDILSSSGTIYAHSPVVPVLIDAINKGYKKIAVVATPCKVDAVADLFTSGGLLEHVKELTIITIGLFCSESFLPEKLLALVGTKVDPSSITKMKISSGMLWVHTPEGKESFGLTSFAGELDTCTKESCKNCHDLTAERADISVGNVGSDSKHNTVLVRTQRGKQAFDSVVSRGLLSERAAKKEELAPLIELAWKKKERATIRDETPAKQGHFKEHAPVSWNIDEFDYTPEVHAELYKRVPCKETVINTVVDGPNVVIGRV